MSTASGQRSDAFDLLGVSFREDSYTDLLANGFNECEEFREGVVCLLGEPSARDWRARQRIRISRPAVRKADVPDMVLFSHELGRLLVIENKIWSEESAEQLARYSTPEFIEALAERLGLSGTPSSFRLVYLTVEDQLGAKEQLAECFTYDDLCAGPLARPIGGDSVVASLLNQMADRFKTRAHWAPLLERPLQESFTGGPMMLSSRERLLALLRRLPVAGDFEFGAAVVNNQQHGETPLVQLRMQGWAFDAPDIHEFSRSSDAHFELQWLRANDEDRTPEGLSVELHFETSPYMPRQKAKEDHEEFERFDALRKSFRDSFLDAVSSGWRRPRAWGWVTAAAMDHEYIPESGPIWLPPQVPALEALGLISAALEIASPVVSETLAQLRS